MPNITNQPWSLHAAALPEPHSLPVCVWLSRILSALIVFTRSQTSHQWNIQPWPRARNNTCHFLTLTTTISQCEDDRLCSSLAVQSDFGLTYFVIGPICLCKMIVLTFLSWPLQAVSLTKSVTLDLLETPDLRPGPHYQCHLDRHHR